jgi:hypothetical protein
MPTLSSSIVKQRVASMHDVEEALARQVLYGGDLATNLLELAAVPEADLTQLLAESHALAPAAIGELPRASEAVLRLVPGELAQRHAFFPLEEREGVLRIAVSEPLPPEVEEDLCFALGVRLEQSSAPVVRIRQAIARDYALPLDRRTLRLIAKLEGHPDPSPSSLPAAPLLAGRGPSLPRPASVPPIMYPPETELSPPGMRATPPPPARATPPPPPQPPAEPPPTPAPGPTESQAATTRDQRRPTPAAQPKPEPAASPEPAKRARSSGSLRAVSLAPASIEASRRRHRGPYTAAMAEDDLMRAESRDDALRAFFDFVSQYFEYCALFAVQSDIAEGRDAHGPGASAERISRIGVPLDLPGALSAAKQEGTWRLHRLESEGLDASLAKDLERPTGKQVLLAPVIVRGRCVLILYGDHGDADVSLSEVGDVIAFAPLVAASLERVILRRKVGARQAIARELGQPLPLPMPMARQPRPRAQLPPPEARARALAAALEAATPAPGTVRASPAAKSQLESPITQVPSTGLESPGAKRASVGPPTPAESPIAKRITAPPPADSVATVISPFAPEPPPKRHTPPQGTPKRLDAETEPQPFPLTRRMPRAIPAEEPPEDGWEPPLATEEELASSSKASPRRSPTAPGLGEKPPAKAPALEPKTPSEGVLIQARPEVEEVPLAPSSRSIAYGPQRLRPRQSAKELALPSVIIDVENDCRQLVEQLIAGDGSAADQLVEIGEPAVSVLVSRFPGPITVDPRRLVADAVRASECGPLMRTVALIGPVASPFLVVRTADAQPDVRAWATRMLGEMPSMESARAVARRFLDSDDGVRRAALAAGRLLQVDEEARAALRDELAQLSADGSQPNEVRLGAIEGLAEVRDPRAVPRLVPLLADPDAEIVKSAHWALQVLARDDRGGDPKAWHEWWRENGGRHRIEWLIDALMNDSPELRRAAADELKALTREYFGYYDDLPPRERAKAQESYREWWDTKGKARFR